MELGGNIAARNQSAGHRQQVFISREMGRREEERREKKRRQQRMLGVGDIWEDRMLVVVAIP